jgi:aryl-alcohol dehydrogenase-like predicted oxidoreductase
MDLSRREFLVTAAGAAAAPAAAGMPTRTLGRTGVRVSILGFGCGSRFMMYKEEEKAIAAIQRALELGITYFDTAASYGKGVSEEWVGKALEGRKDVFVVTKVSQRKADEAMPTIEASLKKLRRHPDLIHIHALAGEEDLAAIEAQDGVLKLLYRLRDEKVCRFLGVTCHADPAVLKTMLERHDLDCVQMALNAAMATLAEGRGRGYAPETQPGATFEELALPTALEKKMGVTAMKVFAQDKLAGQAPAEMLLRYAMSLPVAAAVIGMPQLEQLEANARLAQNFRPLSPGEMQQLRQKLAGQRAALMRFFRDHADG